MPRARGLAIGTLVAAILAEIRESAPGVELSAECSTEHEVLPEIEPVCSVAHALLRIGLTFRPCSAKLFVRAGRRAWPKRLELVANDVAREAPVARSEWKIVEESIALIEDQGAVFGCRWLPDTRRYVLRAELSGSAVRAAAACDPSETTA